ncbi:MAG: sodium ion-translocating decarboxylase subunit beta [Deferribacteraceae bacterium]|jgi:oxaloacetate decarboxylase beta subunit|nr:sodium ion-translocating decarboxylase subunit beta [Deferribacteraceae bacterium]
MTVLLNLLQSGAFYNFTFGNLIMVVVGIGFITFAVKKQYEPLLLVPIGFGIIVGNIPVGAILMEDVGIYEAGTVFNIFYQGVLEGWYPPLIFLGVGVLTDFSAMLSNPKLILLGAAAQLGIFMTFIMAIGLGFTQSESGAIAIIGGADGPTSIFLAGKLADHYLGPIAIAAYSYMALIPVIQPPVIRLLTSRKERLIRMKPSKMVSKRMLIMFPVVCFIITASLAPGALTLLGMLFFGNFLRECGVTDRLAGTAKTALIDIITIVLGLSVGISTQADRFLTVESVMIFGMGAFAFAVSTAGGVIFAKIMNLFLKDKINPIIGAAGVSAVPGAARVCQIVGAEEDPTNYLITHAMAPNVAGVIGSAVAAGVFLAM